MATKTETTATDILPSGVDKILVASNTGGKEISLNSNAFLSLEYSESILHDTPQCLIQFTDTGSVVLDVNTVIEGLPLVGQEKVTLKFTDNLGTSLGDMDMLLIVSCQSEKTQGNRWSPLIWYQRSSYLMKK